MHRISNARTHPSDARIAKKAPDEWDHTRVCDDHVKRGCVCQKLGSLPSAGLANRTAVATRAVGGPVFGVLAATFGQCISHLIDRWLIEHPADHAVAILCKVLHELWPLLLRGIRLQHRFVVVRSQNTVRAHGQQCARVLAAADR